MTKTISRKDIKKKFGVKCFPPIRAIVEEMACSNDFMATQTEAPNYSLIAVSIDSILIDIQTKGGCHPTLDRKKSCPNVRVFAIWHNASSSRDS